jgi:hypothetical protein
VPSNAVFLYFYRMSASRCQNRSDSNNRGGHYITHRRSISSDSRVVFQSSSEESNNNKIGRSVPKDSKSSTTTTTTATCPPDDVDPREVEDLLSQELQQLSFQKRSVIQEEIHGVRNQAVDETPESRQKALDDMAHHLDNVISSESKKAYLHCKNNINSSYVMGSDFRLRFLRSELFDAPKAATRMVGFLDMLVEYYGTVALQRPIQMSDLGKDAMELLRAGQSLQMLPFRDRSGRRVLTVVTDFGMHFDYDTRVRT